MRFRCVVLGLIALAFASLEVNRDIEAQGGSTKADSIIGAFNTRNLGSPGLRRVRLELVTDGKVIREFETAHAWLPTSTGLRSLVLLEQPENLRGTSYLLVEREQATPSVEVYLLILAGKRRVLQIQPGRFDEGLLGSDFSYVDLLWRIQTDGRELVYRGESKIGSRAVHTVDVIPRTEEAMAGSAWGRIRYHFDLQEGLLQGAEFFEKAELSGSPHPAKKLSVHGWKPRDGVWAPTEMIMSLGPNRLSRLTLLSQSGNLKGFEESWFQPESLAAIAADLIEGSLPTAFEGN